jgi:hypothetical protein
MPHILNNKKYIERGWDEIAEQLVPSTCCVNSVPEATSGEILSVFVQRVAFKDNDTSSC